MALGRLDITSTTTTTSSAPQKVLDYRTASPVYRSKGWTVIPVRTYNKSPVESGCTGRGGVVTTEKMDKWRQTAGTSRVSVRHDGTISIDIDHYGDKEGADDLKRYAAERSLPNLPATYSSTARGADSPSRQYFYRVPPGTELVGDLGEAIDICQFHHRHSLVYPSVHETVGEQYTWYQPGRAGVAPTWGPATLDVPAVAELPYLPDAWIEALSTSSSFNLNLDAEVIEDVDQFLANLRTGEPSYAVKQATERALNQHPGHNETRSSLKNAFMLGREGHRGVPDLYKLIYERHYNYVMSVRPHAIAEVDRLVRDTLRHAQQCELSEQEPILQPLSALASPRPTDPEDGVPTDLGRFHVPVDFWNSTPELKHIFDAAISQRCSPEGILHSTLAYISALVPYGTTVDTGLFFPSVLNYFAAIIGPSGKGKGNTMRAASRLMKEAVQATTDPMSSNHGFVKRQFGSGEGMIEQFIAIVVEMEVQVDDRGEPLIDDSTGEPITKKVRKKKQVRNNALFTADEGRQALTIGKRNGSTLFSTLCSLWSGSEVGNSNKDEDSSRQLDEETYALGAILGFQPAHIEDLFTDTTGGSPQRFSYAPTTYPLLARYADNLHLAPEFPGPLSINIPTHARSYHLPDEIKLHLQRKSFLDGASDITDEEGEELFTHRTLVTARCAALLAILHNEKDVSLQMWDLANTLIDHSFALGLWLAGITQRKEQERNDARRTAQVATKVAETRAVAEITIATECLNKILDRLPEDGSAMSQSDLKKAVTPRLRVAFDGAIAEGVASGVLIFEEVPRADGRGTTKTYRLKGE